MKDDSRSRVDRVRAVVGLCTCVALSFAGGRLVAAQGDGAAQLRRYIDQQVGGLQKLMVPSHNSELPQPRLANGNPDPQFETTEAKRYLGKLLFHDPARATRIITEFGGIPDHAGTASCGTCHRGIL